MVVVLLGELLGFCAYLFWVMSADSMWAIEAHVFLRLTAVFRSGGTYSHMQWPTYRDLITRTRSRLDKHRVFIRIGHTGENLIYEYESGGLGSIRDKVIY